MPTREDRKRARVSRAQARIFETMAEVSAALAAGDERLAERRLPAVHSAAAALSELLAKLHRADERTRRRRSRRR